MTADCEANAIYGRPDSNTVIAMNGDNLERRLLS
jgi:hypothetical protein